MAKAMVMITSSHDLALAAEIRPAGIGLQGLFTASSMLAPGRLWLAMLWARQVNQSQATMMGTRFRRYSAVGAIPSLNVLTHLPELGASNAEIAKTLCGIVMVLKSL